MAAKLFFILIPVMSAHAVTAADGRAPFWFGDYQTSIQEARRPGCVAIDKDGAIYVTDAGARRVRRFLEAEGSEDAWRHVNQDRADFVEPHGLAPWGKQVFVTDRGRHEVLVLSRKGKLRGRWGGLGREPGRLRDPSGIAVSDSRVYVADSGNRRVQIFDHKGRLIRIIENPGTDAGHFLNPVALELDTEENLYVADSQRHRIFRFDSDGAFLGAWGDWGFHPGLLDEPAALAWHAGWLLVLERRNHRVQAFNRHGKVEAVWGLHEVVPHEGGGKLHYPDGLAVAPDGGFAVIGESIEDRIQVFAPAPPDAPKFPQPGEDPGRLRTHFGEYVSSSGPLMTMADPERHLVYVFDTRSEVPIIIHRFGERGEGFGLLNHPTGLALDAKGEALWIADQANARLQKFQIGFDPAQSVRYIPDLSTFAKAVSYSRLARGAEAQPPWPLSLGAIQTTEDKRIYALDIANARIRVYAEDWSEIRSWGGLGEGAAQFGRPTDFCFSGDGRRILVVDQLRAKVQAFDLHGKPLHSFAVERGVSTCRPFGICSDQEGHVYLTDQANHEILKFDEKGRLIQKWGGRGADMGQLWHPTGIALDVQGRLIVIDQGNHRAQIFGTDGAWLATFGAGRAYTPKNRPRKRTNP